MTLSAGPTQPRQTLSAPPTERARPAEFSLTSAQMSALGSFMGGTVSMIAPFLTPGVTAVLALQGSGTHGAVEVSRADLSPTNTAKVAGQQQQQNTPT